MKDDSCELFYISSFVTLIKIKTINHVLRTLIKRLISNDDKVNVKII